jgi:hypothetical protein
LKIFPATTTVTTGLKPGGRDRPVAEIGGGAFAANPVEPAKVASGLDVVGESIPPNVTDLVIGFLERDDDDPVRAVRREPDGDRLEAGAGSVEIDLLLDRVLLELIVVA